jgi:hypothetical protein
MSPTSLSSFSVKKEKSCCRLTFLPISYCASETLTARCRDTSSRHSFETSTLSRQLYLKYDIIASSKTLCDPGLLFGVNLCRCHLQLRLLYQRRLLHLLLGPLQ